ncbi:MAG: hypothetical protein ACKESB_02295 [Candidatus Hodgkinia cicadicola]
MSAVLLMLSAFSLMILFTVIWVFWYYKAERKNKAFYVRYKLMGGKWSAEGFESRQLLSWAFYKTAIMQLMRFALDGENKSGVLKVCELLAAALILVQAVEMADRKPLESRTLLYELCVNTVLGLVLASSVFGLAATFAENEAKRTLSDKTVNLVASLRMRYWITLITVWEVLYVSAFK